MKVRRQAGGSLTAFYGALRDLPGAKCTSISPPLSGTVTGRASATDASCHMRDGVGAGRHVVDPVAAVGVGDGEEAVREHQDERAHVRMDVAEDAHDARPLEADGLRSARRVAPEIEAAHVGQREHVVIGAIVVREVDDRADGDRQHARHEALVALIHADAALVRLAERAARRALEIHDADRALVGVIVPVIAAADRRDRRPPIGAHRLRRQIDAAANRAVRRAHARRRARATAAPGWRARGTRPSAEKWWGESHGGFSFR